MDLDQIGSLQEAEYINNLEKAEREAEAAASSLQVPLSPSLSQSLSVSLSISVWVKGKLQEGSWCAGSRA
jgi:hypothetical protein